MLSKVDRLMLGICALPHFKQRLEALQFRLLFDEHHASAAAHLRVVEQACEECTSSERFGVVLEMVRSVDSTRFMCLPVYNGWIFVVSSRVSVTFFRSFNQSNHACRCRLLEPPPGYRVRSYHSPCSRSFTHNIAPMPARVFLRLLPSSSPSPSFHPTRATRRSSRWATT